jgi:tetratricopeptide (TPR) repeat protein
VIVDVTYAMLLGEGDPALPRLRGISRLGRGEAELGLRSLEACVKIEPNDSMAVYLQGIALWSLERFDEAEPVLRTAIEKGVQRATAYAKLAWIERCRGNIELAQAEVARSLEADPKQLGAHGVLCFIHVDRGEWKAALVDYEAWSGDEPPSLYDRLFQWICRAHVGEREAATEALRSAIEGEKDRTDLVAVARAILGEGPAPSPEGNAPPDREERKRMCEAHFLLGMWREVEGDAAGARAHHQRVLAMNRTDLLLIQSARVALARLDGAK